MNMLAEANPEFKMCYATFINRSIRAKFGKEYLTYFARYKKTTFRSG